MLKEKELDCQTLFYHSEDIFQISLLLRYYPPSAPLDTMKVIYIIKYLQYITNWLKNQEVITN